MTRAGAGRFSQTLSFPGTSSRSGASDRILLSTGRISSEMLLKAARMAVALAEQLNITVCGYVRGEAMNLYAGGALLVPAAAGAARG